MLSIQQMQHQAQQALIHAKRTELQENYGAVFSTQQSNLPPEIEIAWLDHILTMERELNQLPTTTVRQKLDNPQWPTLEQLAPHDIAPTITRILSELAHHNIVVEFLGDTDPAYAYQYLTTKLLDEELELPPMPGMIAHFVCTTPTYDVQMWVENYVGDVLMQERLYFLPCLSDIPLFNMDGSTLPFDQFRHQVESVWQKWRPTQQYHVEHLTTRLTDDDAWVTAAISWHDPTRLHLQRLEATFRLRPSPYEGWDVVQTSFIEDLLAL
ncbi:MAG TPA: hypothetical protein VLL52_15240 [Anaerolineae bacterium]|nr:hypothetical protein [Anaerolineae bacterium]